MSASATAPQPRLYFPVLVVPEYRPRRIYAILLFFLTLMSTTIMGARMEFNFRAGAPPFNSNTDIFPFAWIWHHPALLLLGLPFSITLMAILLAHELGHYLACRHYGVEATWPHFLPAPTLIGTLGAFIRIRSPFRNRRELFDVGVAGPLAGFVLALPLLAWGLASSRLIHYPPGSNALEFGWPPVALALLHWMKPAWPAGSVYLSPVARAAWVGLLATMLNLIPAGQLDGGHILYTFFPRLHRWVSWLLVPILLLAGWRFWQGWYFWAGVILLMRGQHPYVPSDERVGWVRTALAVAALAMLALTFMPVPLWIN
jgi:membrane-associated protease RseP (regulator of RpoE activity)